MGSKNRIFLGIITTVILHSHRNLFVSHKLYISKKKSIKIQDEHPLQAKYINEHNFQILLDNVVGSYRYKENGIINFITNVDDMYLIFGISINNHHTELSTVFKPSIRQLIKCSDKMAFFNKNTKEKFQNHIT